MSAQLLVCKYGVFTLFLLVAFVTCMVHWLAVCQDPSEQFALIEKKLFVLVLHEEGRKQGNKREKLLELLHLRVEM